jgi:hypothetical protein
MLGGGSSGTYHRAGDLSRHFPAARPAEHRTASVAAIARSPRWGNTANTHSLRSGTEQTRDRPGWVPGQMRNRVPYYEDNLVLDLAAEVGAMLLVSSDTDGLVMSPGRGTPILAPPCFATKVDAMRRHARRRPH